MSNIYDALNKGKEDGLAKPGAGMANRLCIKCAPSWANQPRDTVRHSQTDAQRAGCHSKDH